RRCVGAGTVCRQRPRQLVLRGCLGQGGDHLRQVAGHGELLVERIGAGAGGGGGEERPHVIDQRRAGGGGTVLVAVAGGEDEALTGEREAGVEEVALLGLGVAAGV